MPLYNPSNVSVAISTSGTSTASSVNANNANTVIVASNVSRKGLTLFNNSSSNLYIDFGKAASITDSAVKIAPEGYYELPFNYTSAINGIWDAANGNVRVRLLFNAFI